MASEASRRRYRGGHNLETGEVRVLRAGTPEHAAYLAEQDHAGTVCDIATPELLDEVVL